MKIILDTNIVLDVLMKREGFYDASYGAVRQAILDNTDMVLPASIITDAYYILNRNDKTNAKAILEQFVRLTGLSEVTPDDIMAAFASEIIDFEDAVVAAVAVRVGADYIVTRNAGDFEHSPVPAIAPQDFLMLFKRQ
jgi:predicted nucleic acid-binding protein